MNRLLRNIVSYEKLPFQIGVRDRPANAPYPDSLPFKAALDPVFGLVVQEPNHEVADWMDKIYHSAEPLGTPMAAEGLGRRYADDFLEFLVETVGPNYLTGRHVVEIGSGTGYLVKRLAEMGADVLGIEPGASGRRAQQQGLPIINEMFHPGLIKKPVDVFLHFAVLEHLRDPLDFIRTQQRLLASDGRLVFSVPNCTWPISHGDTSMFVHEHWSYFTAKSLDRIGSEVGCEVEVCQPSKVGGSLYSAWRNSPATACETTIFADDDVSKIGEKFVAMRARIKNQLLSWHSQGSVGIFVPARIINYLPDLEESFRCRLFDDDPNLVGKYYPPFDWPVENRASLIQNPVKYLLIMSTSFGAELAASLKQEPSLASTEIMTLVEV